MPTQSRMRIAAAAITIAMSGAALLPAPARAQQQDSQFWWQTNATLPLTGNLRLTLEEIARFSDLQDGLYTTEYGGLVSYRVAKGVDLGVGYRYVSYYNLNTARDENRLRQQVVLTRGPLLFRFRVDERFHPAGSEIGFRLRPFIRYNQKLRGTAVMLFASHESFILPNTTAWGQRSGYERMRNILGVTVPLSKALSADIGYLNQYRLGRDGARGEMDHALTIQLSIDLGGIVHPKADD